MTSGDTGLGSVGRNPSGGNLPSDMPGGAADFFSRFGGASSLAGATAGGAGRTAQQNPVFLGWKHDARMQSSIPGLATSQQVPQVKKVPDEQPADNVKGHIYNWSKERLMDFKHKAISNGMVNPEAGIGELSQVWSGLVDQASNFYSQDKKVTPMGVLDKYSSGALSGGNLKMEERKIKARQTSIDRIAPESARSMLANSMMESLGREPTDSEFKTFLSKVRQAETKNPTVSSQDMMLDPRTGQTRPADPADQRQVTQEGLDHGAWTEQYTEDVNPEEQATYQAAGYYFPMLMQAVGAPV